MTDIFTNTSAWGLLDEEMKEAFRAHEKAGGGFVFYDPDLDIWAEVDEEPYWNRGAIYRAIRPTLTPDKIAWDRLPSWAKYVARDEEGPVHCCEFSPNTLIHSWELAGDYRRIDDFPGLVEIGTVDWKDSLQTRPEGV